MRMWEKAVWNWNQIWTRREKYRCFYIISITVHFLCIFFLWSIFLSLHLTVFPCQRSCLLTHYSASSWRIWFFIQNFCGLPKMSTSVMHEQIFLCAATQMDSVHCHSCSSSLKSNCLKKIFLRWATQRVCYSKKTWKFTG